MYLVQLCCLDIDNIDNIEILKNYTTYSTVYIYTRSFIKKTLKLTTSTLKSIINYNP